MANKFFVFLLITCVFQWTLIYASPSTGMEDEDEKLTKKPPKKPTEKTTGKTYEEEEEWNEDESTTKPPIMSDTCPDLILYEKDDEQLPNVLKTWFVDSVIPQSGSESSMLECGLAPCTVALGNPTLCKTVMMEISSDDISSGKLTWVEYGLTNDGGIIINEILMTIEDESLVVGQIEIIKSIVVDEDGNEEPIKYTKKEKEAILAPWAVYGTNGFYDFMILAPCQSQAVGNQAIVLFGEESIKTKSIANFEGGISGPLTINGLSYDDLVKFPSTKRIDYNYTPTGTSGGEYNEEEDEEENKEKYEKNDEEEETEKPGDKKKYGKPTTDSMI